MQQATQPFDTEGEYRAIEAALLETATGRWFLSEHGRRSRRIDNALLEDAIGRLQSSLRQPPALLGQLQAEISELRLYLAQTREELMSRGQDRNAETGQPGGPVAGILRAAEQMHELAWGLHARDIDPASCEAIARQASQIFAMSAHQAAVSERVIKLAAALDEAGGKLAGVLETITHELQIDEAFAPALPAGGGSVPALDEASDAESRVA